MGILKVLKMGKMLYFVLFVYLGCFEKPSMTNPPTKNLSCPEILPLAHSFNIPNGSSMSNESRLTHPDAENDRRFISGTRLQMQKKRTSHKKKTCSFHDLDNAQEGKLISSMNQEALQNTRKSKTIQQDRLRGFCTSFLANFLQDYFHNLKRAKDQERRFMKMGGAVEVRRDPLTRRVIMVDDKGLEEEGGSSKKKMKKI